MPATGYDPSASKSTNFRVVISGRLLNASTGAYLVNETQTVLTRPAAPTPATRSSAQSVNLEEEID